jgi:hypothetical protein
MYKLYKMFTSKAKQIIRDREKEAGGGVAGGIKKDAAGKGSVSLDLEEQYPPLRLTGQVQDTNKQFKVHIGPQLLCKLITLSIIAG